jgi:hypothetical protein
VTPRAKREAQRRERPGVPSLRAGALGARRVALEPRRRGAVGAGQPARTGGGEAPWGMPASCRRGAVGGADGGEKGWHGAGGRTRQSTAGVLGAAAQAPAGCGTLTLKPRPGTRRAPYRTHQSTADL